MMIMKKSLSHIKLFCLFFLFFLLTVLVTPTVFGATIKGTIYDYSLKEAQDVIITIDSVPPQKYISKEGSYEFTIDFGEYLLEAKRYEDNILKDSTSEKIIIDKEGTFILDVLLLPSLEEEEKLFEEIPENFDPYDAEKKTPVKIIFALVSFLLLLLIIYYIKRAEHDIEDEKKKKEKDNTIELETTSEDSADKRELEKKEPDKNHNTLESKDTSIENNEQSNEQGDKYYLKVLEIIKEHQRITQKEIRKDIPLSEAKVSLIISEMESKGLVQKIKKGRGNIIVWKGK